MILDDDHHCFVCGRENPIGLHLNFSVAGGRASAECVLRKDLQGYRDIVHGGIITAILDEAMIKAAAGHGIQAVTAEITVRFRNPLMAGETALVEAVVNKVRKNIIGAEAVIKGPGPKIVAEARGTLVIKGDGRPQRPPS